MSIRPARDDDFTAIAAITNHYIETTAIHFAYEQVSAGELAAYARDERFPWLVVDEGRVVGYAKAGTWRERAAYRWTTEIGLYLDPEARGRGLGRALYAELLPELARRGFRSDASRALHLAVGFESVGVVRDAGFKHERWHDVEFFQKRLQ
jgi:L-amino acid N-acyltransferase YncA